MLRRPSSILAAQLTKPAALLPVALIAGISACGGGNQDEPHGFGGSSGRGGSGNTGNVGNTSNQGGTGIVQGGSGGTNVVTGGTTSGGSAGSGTGGTTECASQEARTNLLPVRLAFAFDVSGSMGEGDYPWHDATLKWDPVVAATRAFFEDPASAGLEASLTVFPTESSGDRCEDDSYTTPLVPMTPLPSAAFGTALDAIRADDWRGGTPTLHVVNGVLAQIEQASAANPGRYVLVLVTDGYPQSCEDNSIDSVANAVAAVADEIPTYVIGVANPPLVDNDGNMAPETVMSLGAVAMAGGTGQAFIIDTGNPTATNAAFTAAVNQIRSTSISCNLAIPSIPDGRAFERDKVAVTYTSGANVVDLTYDASCMMPNSWHYDDPMAPTEIVLCDGTCTTVQADQAAVINVTFTCTSVIDPR